MQMNCGIFTKELPLVCTYLNKVNTALSILEATTQLEPGIKLRLVRERYLVVSLTQILLMIGAW